MLATVDACVWIQITDDESRHRLTSLCRQLMSAIRESWGSTLPAIVDLKMIYEDFDGDFLLLQPTELWPSIASHIRRLIICCR